MSEEKGIFCPFWNVRCCKDSCMLWVEWADGGECAFHAIAVELNQSDESDSKEREEIEEQIKVTDE